MMIDGPLVCWQWFSVCVAARCCFYVWMASGEALACIRCSGVYSLWRVFAAALLVDSLLRMLPERLGPERLLRCCFYVFVVEAAPLVEAGSGEAALLVEASACAS